MTKSDLNLVGYLTPIGLWMLQMLLDMGIIKLKTRSNEFKQICIADVTI